VRAKLAQNAPAAAPQDPRAAAPRARIRRHSPAGDIAAAAAVLGGVQAGASSVAADVTMRDPAPDTTIDAGTVRLRAERAALGWYKRWHPVSIALRSVATAIDTKPMGAVRTGRWRYLVSGYVSTVTTVERWSAEVDGATGDVIAVGPAGEVARSGRRQLVDQVDDEARPGPDWRLVIGLVLIGLALLALL